MHLQYAKIIQTILGTRPGYNLRGTNYARGAIVVIYQFSKILTSNMNLNLDRLLVSVMFLSSLFHKKGPRYLRE